MHWGQQLTLELESDSGPAIEVGPESGYGCRRLLARILYQALEDYQKALASKTTQQIAELTAFWRSEWLKEICLWLDIEHDCVLNFVRDLEAKENDET